jgi:hypothetical protein
MAEGFPQSDHQTEEVMQPDPAQTGPTPPPGFQFNPNIMADYDEQVQAAIDEQAYQDAPLPSFENTPRVDITPTFNPTGAPESEIYARGRRPERLGPGYGLHSEFGHTEPVDIWRIVDRSQLVDGTGLVSSEILVHGSLGDIEHFDESSHLSTEHADRIQEGRTTPFVSFVTDPTGLAKTYILEMGFGVESGRDSVVVRAKVDPSRLLTTGKNKDEWAALVGGVAPDEYVEAYEVTDFVNTVVPPDATFHDIGGSLDPLSRDETLAHWRNSGVPSPSDRPL